MKLTCPFCQTEYSADMTPGQRAICVCCGHILVAPRKTKTGFLLWLAAICLVLSATIFITVAAMQHWPRLNQITERWLSSSRRPVAALTVEVAPVQIIVGDTGNAYWVVSGRIVNNSENLQGIPDLIVSKRNDAGDTISTQRVSPPIPVLAVGESTQFRYTLATPGPDAKQIAVEFVR